MCINRDLVQIATFLRAAVRFPERGLATGDVLSPGTAQVSQPCHEESHHLDWEKVSWEEQVRRVSLREEKSQAGSEKIFLVMELTA